MPDIEQSNGARTFPKSAIKQDKKNASLKKENTVLKQLIKDLWFYHRPHLFLPSDDTIEDHIEEYAREIRCELETAIDQNNNRIAAIMRSFPDAVDKNDTNKFELTEMA